MNWLKIADFLWIWPYFGVKFGWRFGWDFIDFHSKIVDFIIKFHSKLFWKTREIFHWIFRNLLSTFHWFDPVTATLFLYHFWSILRFYYQISLWKMGSQPKSIIQNVVPLFINFLRIFCKMKGIGQYLVIKFISIKFQINLIFGQFSS